MNWSTELAHRLHGEAFPPALCDRLRANVAAYGRALAVVNETEEFHERMVATVGVIVSLEEVEEVAAALTKAARHALAASMMESGATTITAGSFMASVSDPARSVVVTDPAEIPADYMRTPEPAPDKKLIAKAIKDGFAVPGATLSNGGNPTLTIRARKAA